MLRLIADLSLERQEELRYPPGMSEKNAADQLATLGTVTVKARTTKGRSFIVKFGDVVVSGTRPSQTLVTEQVERSTEALERVSKKFGKPGVHMRFKAGVPRYYADENEPGIFFRVMDGKTLRGRLIDGKFQAQS